MREAQLGHTLLIAQPESVSTRSQRLDLIDARLDVGLPALGDFCRWNTTFSYRSRKIILRLVYALAGVQVQALGG
jgi:hypothetical protein